jgi:hypothetical protein
VIDSIVPEGFRDLVAERPWLLVLVVGAVVLVLRLLRGAGAPVARPGEVWFAMVPFREGAGAKDRPVLVLAAHRRTVTVARLTSQDRGDRHEYVHVPTGLPGLTKDSWIELRPVDLDRSALRRRTSDAGEAWVHWYREQAASRGL